MDSKFKIKPFTIPGIELSEWPLIIAGPCSAESEEQVLKTAKALKGMGVNIFRAGIWKPRTSPNGFQGIGSGGLPWLKRVKKETGMVVSTEVGNEKHIEEALKHDVDILWIGARTTTNSFAVEAIANRLEGTNIPVMVKNPIQPELSVWIGAIERLLNHGLNNIAAIHRGFSLYSKSHFRYPPIWEIPLQLKRIFPELTIIIDPSHISGNRKLIPDLCKQAGQLNFDGFMIEVHIEPESALVDSSQQLTPETFKTLLQKLNVNDKIKH